jgi:transposase
MNSNYQVENETENIRPCCCYEKKDLIRIRKKVNYMYFNRNLSKRKIADRVGMSRNFVNKWTQSENQDMTEDQRGWPKGRRRKWDEKTEKRITQIRSYLKEDEKEFYWGPTAIYQQWHRRFPDEAVPPLRTIGQILKDLGLSDHTVSGKGAAKYLCYPEHTIYEILSTRLLETDFVGQKYIRGRTEPLHFIGLCFKKSPRLRIYQRISGPTTDNLTAQWKRFFEKYEKPDFAKVDNAAATIGSAWGKRNVSRAMIFLLENHICPIFSVPRKPFSQASIEGNNSVFAKKFWNTREFSSVDDVDQQIEWFNDASIRYSEYEPPENGCRFDEKSHDEFKPKAYFLRQVRDDDGADQAGPCINVLNENIVLGDDYLNLFVLGEWDLSEEQLTIYLEKDKVSDPIKSVNFPICEQSKEKFPSGGALSSCI